MHRQLYGSHEPLTGRSRAGVQRSPSYTGCAKLLSRPGALQYLHAQPRSAATNLLLWVAEQPGREG